MTYGFNSRVEIVHHTAAHINTDRTERKFSELVIGLHNSVKSTGQSIQFQSGKIDQLRRLTVPWHEKVVVSTLPNHVAGLPQAEYAVRTVRREAVQVNVLDRHLGRAFRR